MPILSNPKATAKWHFEHDADLPPEKRPVFFVRAMTAAQREEHQRLMETFAAAADNAEAMRSLEQALLVGIAGWANLTSPAPDGKPVVFNAEKILELLLTEVQLTDAELITLAWRYPEAVSLTFRDFFRLRSSAPSDTATAPASAPSA